MKFLIILLFLPLFSVSQITYTGNVTSKNDGSKIPYATVGLIKENIGVNADEKGDFILRSDTPQQNDSLIFSSVGFVTQKIPVNINSTTNINVQLVENIITLSEVSLKPNYNWRSSILNDFSECDIGAITSSGFMTQVAQHFVAPQENSRLKQVSICLGPGRSYKSFFRIRVYGLDTLTGGPGDELTDKLIEVKTSKRNAVVNLEEFKIHIPEKDFFVAVEWIKIPFNENKVEFRTGGVRSIKTLYNPRIAWEIISDISHEAWGLNYNSSWQPLSQIFREPKSIFISAEIKY